MSSFQARDQIATLHLIVWYIACISIVCCLKMISFLCIQRLHNVAKKLANHSFLWVLLTILLLIHFAKKFLRLSANVISSPKSSAMAFHNPQVVWHDSSRWFKSSMWLLQNVHLLNSAGIMPLVANLSLVFSFPSKATQAINSTLGGATFCHTEHNSLSTVTPSSF
uniref:Uncharacterized protein n=1 Tax=Opuntia streptacantha TaxID=393608 RepID=A0A7C8ZXU9_OPUST